MTKFGKIKLNKKSHTFAEFCVESWSITDQCQLKKTHMVTGFWKQKAALWI